jgi:hypothetical protein
MIRNDLEQTALDRAVDQWHSAEMEISALTDAITKVLRLQTGVSPQAKVILREALALKEKAK